MSASPSAKPGPIRALLANPPQVESRILREQAQSLLDGNLSQPLSGFLVALGFWVSFYHLMPPSSRYAILVWAGLMHFVQVLRYANSRRYARTPLAQRDIAAEVRKLCNQQAISGIAWGLAPWFFFPTENLPLTALMMLLLLALSSIGGVALSAYRQALLSFTLPIFVGLAGALFWQGDWLHAVLGIGALLYGHSNVIYGLQQNRLLNDSLRARYENEELAKNLAQQVQMVERASLEKTRFFASASHDLRQPLHSLGLFGSAIHARLKNTEDEALASNLMHCVDALETSFSSMLDVSKLDAGVVEVNAKPVGLAQVFRKLQSTYGRQAEAQGLALRFKPGGKWVHADAALLERLLGNLIHNALKFTTQGGVTVLARNNGGQTSIEVWDTGQGMPASEFSRIFDEFYQVGNQERDRSKGLGMGLAIVRRLGQLMQTPLHVHSRPGHGSVFKLVVPAAPVQAASEVTNPLAHNSGVFGALTGLHVLVVDDEATVRASTAAALKLYGLQVEVADGMAQAREVATRLGPKLDAVITDYRLCNGKDGIDIVADLVDLLGRQLPSLLITGDTAPDRVRLAQQSGLRVLYKPVKINTLVEELRQQIASKPLN
jgi:signal transduction histidine kinase/CheY-like chemotaxis protein